MRDDYLQREGLSIDIIEELDAFRLRRYQGARVEMWNRGVFRGVSLGGETDIIHYDVGGMYPTIMILLNLSSENVKLASLGSVVRGRYVFNAHNGIVEIPDSYCGQVRLHVGKRDSVTREFMLRFRLLRQQYRSAKRESSLMESQQRAIKLIMNMTYGYHGLEFSRYGSYLVALATTGTGRFIMDEIIKLARQHSDVTLIECDTDGVYTQGVDISKSINSRLNSIFKDYKYASLLRVSTNRYDGMISYSMKNYVLRKGNKNLFKGASFHGRNVPLVCQHALQRFATAIFNKEKLSEVWKEFLDLRMRPLKEFTMSVQFRKQEYEKGTMYSKLSRKLEKMSWGQDIYYVKTCDGYTPLGTVSDAQLRLMLDTQYYMNRIRDVVKRLTDAAGGVEEVQVRKGGKAFIAGKTKLHEWM